jgi:hypothetical protein
VGFVACKPKDQDGRGEKKFAGQSQQMGPTPRPTAGGSDDGGDDNGSLTGNPSDNVIDDGTVELEPNIQPMVVTGLRNDLLFSSATIELARTDGTVVGSVEWPDEGSTAVIEGACGGADGVTLRMTVRKDGQAYTPANPKCFVGTTTPGVLTFGFEDDCDGLDAGHIDDLIATLQCPVGLVTIESLRLDPSIDVGDWTD